MDIKEDNISLEMCKLKEEEGAMGQTITTLSSCDNADSGPTSGGNTNDSERIGYDRKRKTGRGTRGKSKGKIFKPYNKSGNKDDINIDMDKCKSGNSTGQMVIITSSCDNADSGPTSGGNTNEVLGYERKKKTRRGSRRKPNGKNFKPYNKVPKSSLEVKSKRTHQRCNARLTYDQPEAPNNSNQFLIEDHNFHHIPHLSPKVGIFPLQASRKCNRDSSFTSAETDEDTFYSSPEDEEEFLTKEFSEEYESLKDEKYINMSKNDLIRQILCLEERLDLLTKGDENKAVEDLSPEEKVRALESENSQLKREIERLNSENSLLKCSKCRSSSESSVDSENDSSSSSSSDSSSSSSRPSSPTEPLVNGIVHLNDNVESMEEDIAEEHTNTPVLQETNDLNNLGKQDINNAP